jgi:shikimate kinase
MAGSGKSYWSKKLEQQGFLRITVDDLIEAKLEKELTTLGYRGINDMAKWLGRPDEKKYQETSAKYIDFERDSILEILAIVHKHSGGKQSVVIDTTGSVVYVPSDILRELKYRTNMVYIHTPESAHKELVKRFINDPKPIIWGNVFTRHSGETYRQALARCYPMLLKERMSRYKELADVTLDFEYLTKPKLTAGDIIERITEETA